MTLEPTTECPTHGHAPALGEQGTCSFCQNGRVREQLARGEKPTGRILSDQTAAHLEAWLERWTRDDDAERMTVRQMIVELVASDISLLDTHTWTEIRDMAEVTARRCSICDNVRGRPHRERCAYAYQGVV